MIVARIEVDHDPIAPRKAVAPPKAGADRRCVAREATDRYVNESIVVRDLHARALSRRLHVVGLDLDEIADALGLAPHLVVEAAVNARRCSDDPQCADFLAGLLRNIRLDASEHGLRVGCRGERDGQHQKTDRRRPPQART
ncbi:MAG TPA: hypothetical protein VM115_01145 [Vicinamibacterales bacterium]|nr:hypothetical protein [Vicinamibacterales bacterium]